MPLVWRRFFLGDNLLRQFPIGIRLRLVFACIVLLMFMGSSLALWHLRTIRKHVEGISLAERRMSAVLQVDNSILAMMNHLHRSADQRQPESFAADAARELSISRADIAGAAAILQEIAPETNRQAVILESLSGLLEALPGRVKTLIELARAEDWTALHARLLNQVDHTDDVVAALVREMNRDLADSRRRLREEVGRVELRTAGTLAGTGLLSLLLAALLGLAVTRSITRPLTTLASGARALAQGQFTDKLAVGGTDELAQLAQVFNQTARELEDAYGKLRVSEARFRSLIENASEVILIVSPGGRILYASPSTAFVLGQPAEAFMGRDMSDLLDSEEVPQAIKLLQELSERSGGTQPVSLRLRHGDGTLHSLEGLAANLLADPAVAGIVINARDVSDRLRAEQVLREREDQLRHSQKMEAIGLLAGGIAHDFNNLLTGIMGGSSLILDSLNENDPNYHLANDILRATNRAADLTRQMLAYAGKGTFVIEPVDISDLVRDISALIKTCTPKKVDLHLDLATQLPAVKADASQLQQVAMNLIVNAAEAIEQSAGVVSIRTGARIMDWATIGSEFPSYDISPGKFVFLEVRDSGCGMDEALISRIFDPFFTTKFTGRGLGLSAVLGIVRSHRGALKVISKPGRGTTFTVVFPASAMAVVRSEPVARDESSFEGHETVLVVDDEEPVRNLARLTLTRYGYDVLVAENGQAAIEIMRIYGDRIAAVLLDLTMPVMSGDEALPQLKQIRPDIKIILSSGYGEHEALSRFAQDGIVDFVQKPYRAAKLVEKVKQVIQGNPSVGSTNT